MRVMANPPGEVGDFDKQKKTTDTPPIDTLLLEPQPYFDTRLLGPLKITENDCILELCVLRITHKGPPQKEMKRCLGLHSS